MLRPYKITLVREEDNTFYTFTTSGKIQYKIIFLSLDSLYSEYPHFCDYFYSFIFERIEKRSAKEADKIDPRISHTIAHVIKAFFKKNPEGILSFTCDSLDGKHKARSYLFSKWFSVFDNKRFVKLDVNVNDTYNSVMLSKKRAYRKEIEQAFFDLCMLIN